MPLYIATKEQVSTSVSTETVILNYGSGVYYNLDEVGSFVWNLLQSKPVSEDELVGSICENFDVEPAKCKQDLEMLLADLIHEKLITEIK